MPSTMHSFLGFNIYKKSPLSLGANEESRHTNTLSDPNAGRIGMTEDRRWERRDGQPLPLLIGKGSKREWPRMSRRTHGHSEGAGILSYWPLFLISLMWTNHI